MIGQLVKNRETGRLGIVKSLLAEGRAVVTRCNERGVPTPDTYRNNWGLQRGPGIWISSLNKWEPVVINGPAVQMPLFT